VRPALRDLEGVRSVACHHDLIELTREVVR
jgi:hypothetical protein